MTDSKTTGLHHRLSMEEINHANAIIDPDRLKAGGPATWSGTEKT
jgi:hypothetical protein